MTKKFYLSFIYREPEIFFWLFNLFATKQIKLHMQSISIHVTNEKRNTMNAAHKVLLALKFYSFCIINFIKKTILSPMKLIKIYFSKPLYEFMFEIQSPARYPVVLFILPPNIIQVAELPHTYIFVRIHTKKLRKQTCTIHAFQIRKQMIFRLYPLKLQCFLQSPLIYFLY